MARTSLVHYIAPSAISLTPNCNGSANDIAVYIARGAKIRVFSDAAGIKMNGADYQEWTLTGRNRRLADSSTPYTIYARLSKTDFTDGYLVFVKKQQVSGVWKDKYPYVIKDDDGLFHDVYGQESQESWYIRLGDVSLPVEGQREITLDTGILGTPQYNEEWSLNPDSLPLRVEIGCTIGDEDAGPTPYVFWGQSLVLNALLVEGWESVDSTRLDHWEIQRNADTDWPDAQRQASFASTGIITLSHSRGSGDDFQGAVQTVFTVTAWGYDDGDSSGSQVLVPLGTASICILSETVETFDLVKSSEYVNYNPMTEAYVPANGVNIGVRATDQKGDVFDVTVSQFTGMGLQLSYAPVGSEQWTALTVSGQPQDVAVTTVPIRVFYQKQSINIRLTRTVESDSSGSPVTKELRRSTIAFVSDGEDSANREWIYKQDNATGYDSKTGTAHGEPVSGKTGDDWNADLTDDFVPTGWSDNALPVSATHPDVYTSWRDYDQEHDKWGDFNAPVLWSHWGEKGTDGDGVQYLYKLFDHELTDAERISNIPQNPVFNPTTKEWEAAGWYDDPQAPTQDMPFCYCSIIQFIDGQWGTFQKLGMWSKWSKDGKDGAVCYVERQAVFVPTDTSGVVLDDFQIRVPFRVYAGDERLEVSDASIDEGQGAHYARFSGGIVGVIGTVAGTKLSIVGGTVEGTKLTLDSRHTAGSSEIIIEVSKGVTLDEHLVKLTIHAVSMAGTEYTAYNNIEILSNGIAKDGDTPLSVYKWSTSPDTPPEISGNAYPPAGWSKSAPDRPEGDDQYLWVSYTIKRGNGTVMDWGTPVRISGDTGSAGEDAKEREWVYKVSDTNPGTPANPQDRTIDDYVPAGWTDSPTGVTATARTEWASYRDWDKDTKRWGDFHAPVVWSHYGENGMDGDGVEYVFIRTATLSAPSIVNSPDSRTDSRGHTYKDDEYLPLATGGSLGDTQVETTDNPQGTSKLNPYEWVCKRTKAAPDAVTGKREWEKYSGTMSLWSTYSENVIRLDLDNEMDMVLTDSTGKISQARTITIHATLYDGASPGAAATLVSTAASLAIAGVTPTVSISAGVVTVSWAFTTSNILSAATTVPIIVQYDGINYTASFTVGPSKGEAIFQINPSMTSIPFERDGDGNLTPASRQVGLSITKFDGASTTDYSSATAAGVTVRYSTNAMPSSASAGTGWTSGDITVANTAEMLYIAMFNSSGTVIDKETVPVVRDGKDGASTALCVLERQAVFVPTDSAGKVTEAFQLIVPFKVQVGAAILGVKSAVISEGGTQHYVSLFGGKVAGGPMSVSGRKVTVVGTVSGTKVSLPGSYVAGPSGVIIKVAKGVTLDEHLVSLTITAASMDGKEYTSYGSFEIQSSIRGKDGQNGTNGTDGEDAVNIIANPASVLVNQDLTNTDNLSNLSEVIMFTAMKGKTQLTVSKVEITSTNHCTVNGSNSNTATITSILKNGDVYYDNGDFVCSVRYNDGGTYKTVTGIKIKFYANLLGTWKETVDAGTRTIVAEKIEYEVDEGVLKNKTSYNYNKVSNAAMDYDQWTKDSVGTAGSYKYINKHLSDAEEDIDELESVVGNAGSGLVESVNTLTRTAEQTTSEIKQIKTGKNMLKGALSGSNFRCENIMPYPVHPPVRPNVGTDGWMEAPSGNTYICMPDITLTRGKWYVLSFYTKYTSAFTVSLWRAGYSQPDQQLSISAGTSATRHYTAFKYDGEGSVTITICLPVTTLRYPQLELGESSTSAPTAFEVDSAEETSSRISQSSAEIDASIKNGLNTTGINITDGTIKLKATKVNFYDSTGSSLNSKIWLDNSTGALHAVDGDFSGKITAGEGTIGGFEIGSTSIGKTQGTGSDDGWTFISRTGRVNISCSSTSDNALQVNGNTNLITNQTGQTINITNNGGSTSINGNPLNLNTNANSGAYTNIGNTQSNVVVNAGNTTFNDQVNLNEETNVGANGVMTIQGILAMNSSVKTQSFTLPQSPKTGQFFFCKSTSPLSGDLVITANTNQAIMASDSRSTSTSVNINDDSAIVLYVGSSLWVLFKCN